MQNQVDVKNIELYDGDLYFNNAIVTLTTGEKFVVYGELNSYGIFIVKEKRGSIRSYKIQFGTIEEQQETYNFYLNQNLLEVETLGLIDFYLLNETFENSIADAIIEFEKNLINNTDTMILFYDYSPCSTLISQMKEVNDICEQFYKNLKENNQLNDNPT